jgi:Flp pilus assembly pilin Flp
VTVDAQRDESDRLERLIAYRDDERGVTTIEYTLVLGFMSSISIYATIWLISVLKNTVAVLAIKMAIFLTGFPSS